jgi:hypothetical protein
VAANEPRAARDQELRLPEHCVRIYGKYE